MQEWFNNLKRQEQILLLVCGGLLVVYILIVMIGRPMTQSVETLQVQNKRAIESLQNVKSLAAEYKALEKSGVIRRNSGQNLTRLIDASVKKNQLSMKRFQPSSSGDVQVRFENMVYNNVIAWLNELENGNGVTIKDLSITTGSATGLVNVSVRLRQGA